MPIGQSHRDAVWGSVSYSGGNCQPAGMVESADYNIIYPYALADTVGGRLRTERYRFNCGFGHRGNFLDWGASLSYSASLSYRHRDPRPRNVSGTLTCNVAAALHIGHKYTFGTALGFNSYKQSSSITFYSVIGEPTVYHLTGLGMTYNRFNSLGKNTRYCGTGFNAAFTLMPGTEAGFFASVLATTFGFDYLLIDLNSLPLAHLRHRTLDFEAGWRTRRADTYFSGALTAELWQRRGTENIFGDPTTSIYPLIASLDMYSAGGSSFGAKTAGVKMFCNKFYTSFTASALWCRRCYSYLSPARNLSCDAINIHATPAAYFILPQSLISVGASYKQTSPLKHLCNGFDDSSSPIVRDCLNQFSTYTARISTIGAYIRYDRRIGNNVAIGISVEASHNCFGNIFEAKAIVSL